ncbi:MAG: hypothetical protein ACOH2J_02540 [Allorhizobium sp.]
MSDTVSGFSGAPSPAKAASSQAPVSPSSDLSLSVFESLMSGGSPVMLAEQDVPPFFGADETALADFENAAPEHSSTSASSSTFAYSVHAGAGSGRTAYTLSGTKMDGARSQMLSSAESRIVSNLLSSMAGDQQPVDEAGDDTDTLTLNTTTRFYSES